MSGPGTGMPVPSPPAALPLEPPVPGALAVVPVRGVAEVSAGADLAALLVAACRDQGTPVAAGDVLVVSSKVLSKALGLVAPEGSERDAVVLGQSVRVVAERVTADLLGPDGTPRTTRIVESVAGPVMAAAGVDASNAGPAGALLLLPADPDAEAARLRAAVLGAGGLGPEARLGVVLADTAGRPWRDGLTDFALGAAGVVPLLDHRGEVDHDGRPLAVTARAVVDELAAAADLVKGKADGLPAALVRGVPAGWLAADGRGATAPGGIAPQPTGAEASGPAPAGPGPMGHGAGALVRTGATDWFALGHVEALRAVLGAPPGSEQAARVGVPAATSEPLRVRVLRVVALALLDQERAWVDVEPGEEEAVVVLGAAHDFTVGRLLTRLEVAAASEGLDADVAEQRANGTVSVRLLSAPRRR
ncbi:MAG TPA: coenzyme F420-0:L-glutamate ligase [Dermatophilaceae bacterium]|nr:coenzyme F420-0:L-glutamate ligase [Dermatophilaceae bacterium]